MVTIARKLRTALLIASEGLLPLLDALVPKSARRWTFPYTRRSYWSSNQRAVFDYVRAQRPDLTALPVDLSANGRLWLLRYREIWHLLRSKVVVIHHGPSDYRRVLARSPVSRRVIYNVWHGVNIKTIGLQENTSPIEARDLRSRAEFYHGVSASSEANQRSLHEGLGVAIERVHVTGLPRNDWLCCDESQLPEHLQEQLARLRRVLAGRRLVLYAPTFRSEPTSPAGAAAGSRPSPSAGFYPFAPEELSALQASLEREGAVLGCRAHVNARAGDLPAGSLDLGAADFPETQVLLREAAVLITDYSGIWVDYLLTGRPMVAFVYDRDDYAGERGLIYDMDEVFPGPRVERFTEFRSAVEDALHNATEHPNHPRAKRFFHAYDDAESAARVVNAIERLLTTS